MHGLGWELGLGVPLLWGESLFHPSRQEVMRVPSEDGGENEEAWQRGTAQEVEHRGSGLAVVGGCGSGAQKGLGAGEGVAVLMNCHKLGETAEVHSVTVWEVRGLKSSCQNSAPSEGSWRVLAASFSLWRLLVFLGLWLHCPRLPCSVKAM